MIFYVHDIMPSYSECIKLDGERPDNTIRLIRQSGFLRAYERSAWLFTLCISEYKVRRKFIKSANRDILFLGFPEGSLHEKLDGRQLLTTPYGYDIVLREGDVPQEDTYEEWRNAVAVEALPANGGADIPLPPEKVQEEIIRRLREFPLERKNFVQCAVFLSELRALLDNEGPF